jgi:hypothetical protein
LQREHLLVVLEAAMQLLFVNRHVEHAEEQQAEVILPNARHLANCSKRGEFDDFKNLMIST